MKPATSFISIIPKVFTIFTKKTLKEWNCPKLRICLNVTAAITLESDSPDVDEESEFETYSGSHEDDRFQTHHVSDEETLILRFPSSFFNSLNGYCINEDEEITTQRFIFFLRNAATL